MESHANYCTPCKNVVIYHRTHSVVSIKVITNKYFLHLLEKKTANSIFKITVNLFKDLHLNIHYAYFEKSPHLQTF